MRSVALYTAKHVRWAAGVTQWTETLITDGCHAEKFFFAQEVVKMRWHLILCSNAMATTKNVQRKLRKQYWFLTIIRK